MAAKRLETVRTSVIYGLVYYKVLFLLPPFTASDESSQAVTELCLYLSDAKHSDFSWFQFVFLRFVAATVEFNT